MQVEGQRFGVCSLEMNANLVHVDVNGEKEPIKSGSLGSLKELTSLSLYFCLLFPTSEWKGIREEREMENLYSAICIFICGSVF